MNMHPTLDNCRAFSSQAWQVLKGFIPMHLIKRQRVRISFDIDDTLACQPHHSPAEQNGLPGFVHRWLGEPLRAGTRSLLRELRRQDCSIWVYTSSGRTPAYIRRWLLLHGIRVDGVVNSVVHSQALNARGLVNSPSKLPSAFDIDLHIDDSEGVKLEGHDHGFRVCVIEPDDENWAQKVLHAVADVQAQLAWQQQPARPKQPVRYKQPAAPRAAALTS